MIAPLYTQKHGFIGMAEFSCNEEGEPEMTGFKPFKDNPKRLNKCIPILEKAKEKYPFLKFKINDDVVAIEVWHQDYPELRFAICTMMVEDNSKADIFDEVIPKVKGFALEFWDETDLDNDKILGRMINPYDAATWAIWEIITVDFENTDFRCSSKIID